MQDNISSDEKFVPESKGLAANNDTGEESLSQEMTNVMIPQQQLDQVLNQPSLDQQELQHQYLLNCFNKNSNGPSVLNTDTSRWNSGNHPGMNSSDMLVHVHSNTNCVGTVPGTSHTDDVHSNLLSLPKKRKSRSKPSFPQKLMRILSTEECKHAMRWMPDGCSFCIIDSKAVVNDVLPKHFKEAKYSSFTRKLNRWGFKHFSLPPSEQFLSVNEISIYCHEKFLRHNPSLCEQMDGGHRRSKVVEAPGSPIEVDGYRSIASTRSIQGSVFDGVPLHRNQQREQQHNMLMTMNQLYQTEQQRLTMLRQLIQQEQLMMLRQSTCQQGNHPEALFMGQPGGGGGEASATRSNMIGFPYYLSSLIERNPGRTMSYDRPAVGMHYTYQGLMPYRPIQNLRAMDFVLGTLSSASYGAENPITVKHDANREMSHSVSQSVVHKNASHNTGRAEDAGIGFDVKFLEKFDRK